MNGIDKIIEDKHLETGVDYIDIVCEYAEENMIDYEDLKLVLHENILNKIRNEFIERNMVTNQKNETSIDNFLKKG